MATTPMTPSNPWTTQDIRKYAIGNGWADASGNVTNPWAIHSAAQQFGIGADQLDEAGGWAPGTAAGWASQNNAGPLGGAPSQPGQQQHSTQDIQQYAIGNGWADASGNVSNPWAIHSAAQQHGIGSDQLDQAGGWAPGTAAGWAKQNNAAALPGTPGMTGAIGGQGGTAAGSSPLASNPWTAPQPTGGNQVGGAAGGPAPYAGSNGGYYEQQTPMGSFGASMGAAPVQQQRAQTSTAANPYIGQTTRGIQGAPSVSGIAQRGQYANPWLGGQSQQAQGAGKNAYAGANPYLEQNIQAAQDQTTKSFGNVVAPQLARMEQASGSFGNTGVQGQQQQAYDALGQSLANTAGSMRMQDYTQQQGLAENALNRQQGLNTFNASLADANQGRNMAGGFTQAGMNSGMLMDAGKFDASNIFGAQTANAGIQQNDLGRNTNAAMGLGTFNAGQLNQGAQWNAGQGNSIGLNNAQMLQQNGQFNTSQGNTFLENQRGRDAQRYQFDESLDRSIWNDNQQWARQGQQDQIQLLQTLFGLNGQGAQAATDAQNTPMNYMNNFGNFANSIAGRGQQSSSSQDMQGNWLLSGLGGLQLGNSLFGNQGYTPAQQAQLDSWRASPWNNGDNWG